MSTFDPGWQLPVDEGRSTLKLIQESSGTVTLFVGETDNERFGYLSKIQCGRFAELLLLGETDELSIMDGASKLKLKKINRWSIGLTLQTGYESGRATLLKLKERKALAEQLRVEASRLEGKSGSS